MDLTLTTPSLLFPAISLLLLAYTNRFLTLANLIRELHRKSVEGDWKGMAALITDEMVDTFAVTGTYDTISALLERRYHGLIDRLSLYQPQQAGPLDARLSTVVKGFAAVRGGATT